MQVARNAMTKLIVEEPHAAGNTDYFELHCYIHGPITAIMVLAPTLLKDRTTQTKNESFHSLVHRRPLRRDAGQRAGAPPAALMSDNGAQMHVDSAGLLRARVSMKGSATSPV